MRIKAEAIFDGIQWQGFAPGWKRRPGYAEIVVEERPVAGEEVEGRLAELVDEDTYEARRKVAAESFGGEAFLVIGPRTPAGRRE